MSDVTAMSIVPSAFALSATLEAAKRHANGFEVRIGLSVLINLGLSVFGSRNQELKTLTDFDLF